MQRTEVANAVNVAVKVALFVFRRRRYLETTGNLKA